MSAFGDERLSVFVLLGLMGRPGNALRAYDVVAHGVEAGAGVDVPVLDKAIHAVLQMAGNFLPLKTAFIEQILIIGNHIHV